MPHLLGHPYLTITGVLDISTFDNFSRCGYQGSANAEIGIGSIGALTS